MSSHRFFMNIMTRNYEIGWYFRAFAFRNSSPTASKLEIDLSTRPKPRGTRVPDADVVVEARAQ